MVQITFVSSKKVCYHKLLIFCVKNKTLCLTYRLQGDKLGLKSVIFLCRMYLSMYFSPKKVFCLICWIFFCFDTWIQHAFCPSRGNKNPNGSDTKTLCISIGKELFIKTYKCFWYKPSHSSSLIDRYNAIYVTLDKIQIRRLVHPQKPNHMCNFCLTKKNGLVCKFDSRKKIWSFCNT